MVIHDMKYVLCVAFASNGDVITGDSNGSIVIWPKG
jgi:microtubule-associated protein-like 1/2